MSWAESSTVSVEELRSALKRIYDSPADEVAWRQEEMRGILKECRYASSEFPNAELRSDRY